MSNPAFPDRNPRGSCGWNSRVLGQMWLKIRLFPKKEVWIMGESKSDLGTNCEGMFWEEKEGISCGIFGIVEGFPMAAGTG